jgi:hypothetical protein
MCAWNRFLSAPRAIRRAGGQGFLIVASCGRTELPGCRNERLIEGLVVARGKTVEDWVGSFDRIVGVNTFTIFQEALS